MTQPSPSIRARAHARGSQRLCSLDPEHGCGGTLFVAVAVGRDPSRTVRAARVTTRRRQRYATFTIAPVGTIPCVTYRHSAITSLRATATIPIRRARLPVPKLRLVPLRQRALRLPPHPIPRQLNADRLQPRIARPTDPLLALGLATVVRRGRKPEQPPNLAPIAKRPPE